jgi:hypothetical protein
MGPASLAIADMEAALKLHQIVRPPLRPKHPIAAIPRLELLNTIR